MAFDVLPKLLRYSFSIDLNTRHGALISLAEIIHALCEQAHLNELRRFFPAETFAELKSVLSKVFEEKYFRGTGGELMRPAVCFVLKKLAISKLFKARRNFLFKEFLTII
jgi:tubulin-specific chaperone D